MNNHKTDFLYGDELQRSIVDEGRHAVILRTFDRPYVSGEKGVESVAGFCVAHNTKPWLYYGLQRVYT